MGQSRFRPLVYWEPAWLPVRGTTWASAAGMHYGSDHAQPGNPWANQALFDYSGNALPSLEIFRSLNTEQRAGHK
ncbi:glycosyl hydrolase 53 family protein [Arthrobacter sp. H5]|uniref:glycosyl hydrolase 53 family protein n=1 Tax=Arthrobacter sp. H5 TaxID=1267973 RepID=UPI0004873F2E|nr:glycosyl hydrolase 53 family protein [Arthrobacter sp. H5]